jgi:hypothetical protein
VIRVRQHPDPDTPTPGKSWIASAIVEGVTYTACARHGAANELARLLVAAGIPDAQMKIVTAGQPGYGTIRSFHEAARWTYEETAATKPPHMVRWRPAVETAQIAARKSSKRGVNDVAATPNLGG